MSRANIAVLIPCFDEAIAIGGVVAGFRAALPTATIYVYDNNSRDGTAEVAARAGAVVRVEPMQGKGNVIRRMFADIESDAYVLVDGDGTYDAAGAPAMVQLVLRDRIDMVTGLRVSAEGAATYRPGHRFGNAALTGMVGWIFGKRVGDMLSGYRVFSRRFVKSFPALASGFETETEFTVHALELRLPVAEVPTPYRERPAGSHSKLSTWRDGLRILRTIGLLVQRERPLAFFALAGLLLLAMSVGLALPLLATYVETGLVPRFPTAILATGLGILACLSFACGLILDTVTRGRLEAKRMAYLALPAFGTRADTGAPGERRAP
jgi:glycosyltransferase involved in cell wall biosynthesis